MNEQDFEVLDNSLTLRNQSPEQKKSIARLMELAIEEALLKKQSFQQSVQRIDYWFAFFSFLAGLGAGYLMCILSTINR